MKQTLLKLSAAIFACGALLTVTLVAVAVPLSWLNEAGSGKPENLTFGNLEQRSYIYAKDGKTLSILRDEFNRQPITLKDIPPKVVDAILAVEDRGFWMHDGVNVRGIMRAFSTNLGAGGVAQGGSTITQQLVKLERPADVERSVDHKIQEFFLAQRLEKEYTKEQILTRYLNKVWFGNHAYGIQAAAETYFGVSPKKLNMGQAAMLAGLIRNPNTNNPFKHPKDAKNRRLDALRRMEDAKVITHAELQLWNASPLPTHPQQTASAQRDYFSDAVRSELLDAPWLGKTKQQREQAINRGGMRIYTTLDTRAQDLAIQARNANTPGVNGVFQVTNPQTGGPADATAAVVTIEHGTGAVRALVGGSDFKKLQFNLVTDNPRNTGSAAKTFVLTSLMEQGYSPYDIVDGTSPCTFHVPSQTKPYTVDGRTKGRHITDTITTMTTKSVNCAFVRLGLIAGLDKVVDVMKRLGIPDAKPYASLPLGGNSVTPLQMAGAYGALANDGVYNQPYLIDKVTDSAGKVIYQHKVAPTRAVSSQAARLVTQILQKNVQYGTGKNAQLPGGRPAAGKTGTATNNDNVWFCGYTAQYTTVVQIGAIGGTWPLRVPGQGQFFGGNYPAKIWGALMGPLSDGLPSVGFPAPDSTRAPKFLTLPRDVDMTGAQPPPVGFPVPGQTTTTQPGQLPGWPPNNGNGKGKGKGFQTPTSLPRVTIPKGPPATKPTWPVVTTTPTVAPDERQREASVPATEAPTYTTPNYTEPYYETTATTAPYYSTSPPYG